MSDDDQPGHTYGAARYAALDDGRRLHYWVRGTGSPTVVFESGAGMSGATWGLVQPAVAAHTTTVVYDRAGAGDSDDDNRPRSMQRMVDDLAQLLRHLEGPFVLVGASLGGPLIRSVAATGEFAIRGLVLVDQADEHGTEIFSRSGENHTARTVRLTAALARLGLYRLFAWPGRHQPADVQADLRRHLATRGARQMAAELVDFLPALYALHENPPRLDDIEVAVISGTKNNFLERKTRPAINRAHTATAAALAMGRLVEARSSGHYIAFSEPEIVVGQILSMLGT
ncbi:alpha/beta fold hydrolase [Mycolicibacillus parakoreensis]|uniref:Alpha/beta hydrolase n=1 Tax=Mycolicibacillus parakoreensis TaxID=1069221 RepID=A0ABY3U4B4_9MYCO|nr:alpha/beta hydrolase [Mycolicibacillus parakoreensis]ULN52795.1 alpha/beta hydrolase [Mycolicibacillus parakoreensis]